MTARCDGQTCTCGIGPWSAQGVCDECGGVDLGVPVVSPVRIDLDAPIGNEVWVIRLEHRNVGRLKATISESELDSLTFPIEDMIAAKARGLAAVFVPQLTDEAA